jgi:type IV secretory pathway TrbF-like protein
MSNKIVVLPYVVALRPGEVAHVGTIPTPFDMGRNPEGVYYLLHLWAVWVRGIVVDPVAFERQWTQAKALMSSRAQTMLSEFKQQQKTRMELGKAVSVEHFAAQPLAGSDGRIWEMHWQETTVGDQGWKLPHESGRWRGTVKVAQMPPRPLRTKDDYLNPLRVYVEDIQWQQLTKGQ